MMRLSQVLRLASATTHVMVAGQKKKLSGSKRWYLLRVVEGVNVGS